MYSIFYDTSQFAPRQPELQERRNFFRLMYQAPFICLDEGQGQKFTHA